MRKKTVTLEFHPYTHKPYVLITHEGLSEQRFQTPDRAIEAAGDYLLQVTKEPERNVGE